MMCNLFATWCTSLLSNVFYPINESNHKLYFYCQNIPTPGSTQIFHLRDLFCSIYDLYNCIDDWSTHSPYSTQRFHLRETCCFICIVCWVFFWLIFYWHIFWVKAGNFLFRLSSVAHVFETLNPCSIFLYTLYIILSPNVVLTPLHLSPLT